MKKFIGFQPLITSLVFFFLFSFAYSKDSSILKLNFPILESKESKIGGIYIGSIETNLLKFNDKTNSVLSLNPLLFEFPFAGRNLFSLGIFLNVYNLGQDKAENLQIFEGAYSYNIISNQNTILSVKLSDKYLSGYLNEEKIKENTINLNLFLVHKIWDIGSDGVRIFARTGFGYLFQGKNLVPNLYLGISLGRGISLSIDVLSFLTKYKTNAYLINSTLMR